MADDRALARRIAVKYGLNPALFLRLVNQESGWQRTIVSPAGAQGYTQLMPDTARSLGITDPFDAEQNLDGGARYLRQQLDRFGSYRPALAAYNAGPGNVENGRWTSIPETVNYVNSILGGSGRDFKASDSSTPTPSPTPAASPPAPPGQPPQMPQQDAGQATLDQAAQIRRTATANLGKIATGEVQPTDALAEIPKIIKTYMANTSAVPPVPGRPSSVTTPTRSSSSEIGARGGIPVADLSSVGAEHDTLNLAGYPAHDYFAPSGSAVIAPVSGKVIRLSGHDPRLGPLDGPHGPLGWSVYVEGVDGSTYYMTHMGSRFVKEGQTVKAGQVIGTVADYARYGTPSHIHMGVHRV